MNGRIDAFRKRNEAIFYHSIGADTKCLELLRESCRLWDQALDHSRSPDDRKYISRELEETLVIFENIKNGTYKLTQDEKLSYMSSKLTHGASVVYCYPFTHNPNEQDFVGLSAYLDESYNKAETGAHGVSWISLQSIFPQGYTLKSETTTPQIAQDRFNDCSVVASLISVINLAKRSPVFTYEQNHILPLSNNSKLHWVRLHLNGIDRFVEIDESLPTVKVDNHDTQLFLQVESGPVWPLLAEKAYMKVAGGYGFKGSHSALDTFILTGWIPEYISLKTDNFISRRDKLWNSIYRGWCNCDLMVCVGTSDKSTRSDISPDHDYAIVDVKFESGVGRVLMRDPWTSKIDSSNGTGTRTEGRDMWVDFDSLHHDFDYLYLNWNPSLLSFTKSSTFIWSAEKLKLHLLTGALIACPQYIFENKSDELIKVIFVLERHVSGNSRCDTGRFLGLSLYSTSLSKERISLVEESKLVHSSNAIQSNYNTLRCDVAPGSSLLVVPTMHRSKSPSNSSSFSSSAANVSTSERFTLSVYSSGKSDLYKAKDSYPCNVMIQDQWKSGTAGGNWASDSYGNNPQFTLSIPKRPTMCKLYLFSDSEVPIAVHMFESFENGRIREYKESLLVTGSGKYSQRYAMTKAVNVSGNNNYTIVVSSYGKEVVLNSFWLYCLSTNKASLRPAIRSYAGRFSHSSEVSWSGNFRKEVIVQLERKGLASFKLKSLDNGDEGYVPSLRISVYDSENNCIATTNDFSDSKSGIFLDDVELSGSKRYIAVIERMESGYGALEFCIYTSSPLRIPKGGTSI